MNSLSRTSCLTVLFLMVSLSVFSQTNRWKRMRYEVFGGIGATNFMGELGGADKIGSQYLSDLEISETRPAFTLGARYMLMRRLGIASAWSLGWLHGDDRKTNEAYRQNRNIVFRAPIFEWSVRAEYAILTEKKGHRYNLRKVRGLMGNKITVDAYVGCAAFFFNPQGLGPDGKWYSLQPIGTEGQNYIPTRERYSRISFSILLGMRMTYIINRKWSVSLDFGVRPTFTDYLDDTSSSYADPDLVAKNASGVDYAVAKYLADPSLSRQRGDLASTAPNQERGFSFNNDIYMMSFITLNYKLKTGRNGLPRF